MIAALYVLDNGPYMNLEGVDAYDLARDAKTYRGPHKVIAHPPCERWGRYWGGGPMLARTEKQKLMGDDNQCFAHALWSVRTFGGVLEHPEASHAFKYYGLPIPNQKGGWTEADKYGGRSCCVAQGHYSHRAQKLTWLYGIEINFKELIWGKCPGKQRLDEGFRSADDRANTATRRKRLSVNQNLETPAEFRDLLITLVNPTPNNGASMSKEFYWINSDGKEDSVDPVIRYEELEDKHVIFNGEYEYEVPKSEIVAWGLRDLIKEQV